MVSTGPIPVRIIEALSIESIHERPAIRWYPATPAASATVTIPSVARSDRAILFANLGQGISFSPIFSYIVFGPGRGQSVTGMPGLFKQGGAEGRGQRRPGAFPRPEALNCTQARRCALAA